jgi:hypothetical protein
VGAALKPPASTQYGLLNSKPLQGLPDSQGKRKARGAHRHRNAGPRSLYRPRASRDAVSVTVQPLTGYSQHLRIAGRACEHRRDRRSGSTETTAAAAGLLPHHHPRNRCRRLPSTAPHWRTVDLIVRGVWLRVPGSDNITWAAAEHSRLLACYWRL